MKIVSWNVNGLRACVRNGKFIPFLEQLNADIVCLQEVKMEFSELQDKFEPYNHLWNSAEKKGYAGTAILTKQPPLSVQFGMEDLYRDEGRILTAEYDQFILINCYSPHSKRELARLDYKIEFDRALCDYVKKLRRVKPVFLVGDLNIAHQEIDLKNFKENKNNAGFTQQERTDFDKLLETGLTDSFRSRYPDKTGAYTWWSYRKGVRERNVGWRIDYILVDHNLVDKITECHIHHEILGSDHCPIGINIEI